MARSRLRKTPGDYVAIALGPLLITTLVGSLVLFLLELLYSGQHSGRLRYVLFWFVPASVLVCRIAIEQGQAYAAAFGLALAGATSLVMFRFAGSAGLGAVMLLGVIWWCTNKLTYDCTLIDESEDASGRGLLEAAGFGDEVVVDDSETDARRVDDGSSSDERSDAATQKTHSPGLWVVYFSLAALPVFGIGRLMISAQQQESREYVFGLLLVYVASALGLLLTTSFLGLRRYLRQRRLTMSGQTTRLWVASGAMLIVGILLLCILLPRPQAQYSLTGMLDRVSSPGQEASRHAVVTNDGAEGEGPAGEKTKDDEQQRRNSRQRDDASQQSDNDGGRRNEPGSKQSPGKQQSDQQQGDQKSDRGQKQSDRNAEQEDDQHSTRNRERNQTDGDDEQSDDQASDDSQRARSEQREQQDSSSKSGNDRPSDDSKQNRDDDSPAANDSPSEPFQMPDLYAALGSIAQLIKWLIYVAIFVVILVLAYRNREALIAAWLRLLERLRNLFGRRTASSRDDAQQVSPANAPQHRPFSSFTDPFSSGRAEAMSNTQLAAYTFAALEAWSRDHQLPRGDEQTPAEFTRMLATKEKTFGQELRTFTREYSRLAYSGRAPSDQCREAARTLWQQNLQIG